MGVRAELTLNSDARQTLNRAGHLRLLFRAVPASNW
jgi:hypothetical protein